LSNISIEGNWHPLLDELGWNSNNNNYTSGLSSFRSMKDTNERSFGFVLASESELERIINYTHAVRSDEKFVATSPGGVLYHILYSPEAKEGEKNQNYILNHVALSVRDAEKEKRYWREVLQSEPVLDTGCPYDPVEDKSIKTIHLYEQSAFYITLREEDPRGAHMHHIGWELPDNDYLKKAHSFLKNIGWKVRWKGEIDKSDIIHFEGPDGHVHDFFYTREELRTKNPSGSL